MLELNSPGLCKPCLDVPVADSGQLVDRFETVKLVMRFGIRGPLTAGLLLAMGGLLLFARAPADGTVWLDVVPAMSLLGVGAGIAFNPLLLAAMNDVPADESGLASGMVNTSFMMGGAVGLRTVTVSTSGALSLPSPSITTSAKRCWPAASLFSTSSVAAFDSSGLPSGSTAIVVTAGWGRGR